MCISESTTSMTLRHRRSIISFNYAETCHIIFVMYLDSINALLKFGSLCLIHYQNDSDSPPIKLFKDFTCQDMQHHLY